MYGAGGYGEAGFGEGVTESVLALTGFIKFIGQVPSAFVIQSSRLSPDGLFSPSNLRDSNLVTPPVRLADLADDSGSPDDLWWTAVDRAVDTATRLGFPSSAYSITGTQTINVLVRATSLPSRRVKVELWENGSKLTSETTVDVTSVGGQVVTLQFDTAELSDPTGAGVQVRVASIAAP